MRLETKQEKQFTHAYIKTNKRELRSSNSRAEKKFKNIELIDEIVKTDDLRKESQKRADDASAELNNISKTIGKLFQEGKKRKQKQPERRQQLKDEIKP